MVEAAVHRTRPIVLTAAATVLAMIPLSRSVFWGPMAMAIMGGLIVATVADDLLPAGAVRGVVQGEARGGAGRACLRLRPSPRLHTESHAEEDEMDGSTKSVDATDGGRGREPMAWASPSSPITG